ncbi:hypothetical protein D9757_004621 [Collybiopsis confluens]|uniref:Uncharacterized protein n=1 Tax=Collybiopsis confluens TaxID=2823264 RepID=A0A8H5HS41_9AGAR|nr:hypothetical protein D9757_004621 [Collybiopsis confluens]
MSPAFRPLKLTRPVEMHFPSIRTILEEEDRASHYSVFRPSNVFTVRRHHPYWSARSRATDDDDGSEDEDEDRLVFGIDSSFLIPDWIFEEAVTNNDVVFAPQQGQELEELEPKPLHIPPKESPMKTAVTKTLSFARKLFSSKASRFRL